MTRYRTIVADPPWQYRDKLNMAVAADGTPHKGHRGAESHYPCMDTDAICALPIGEQADSDAHLYLWVTNAFMLEGYSVAASWGFVPKTILTWVKDRLGMGHYFRNTTEHVLFCVRGSLKCLRADMPTHFEAPRTDHSRKPRSFYQIVEMMSPGPYLEVFARTRREGWDAFGNQVEAETEMSLDWQADSRASAPLPVQRDLITD